MVIITQLNHVRPLQLDFERTWAIISVVVLVEVHCSISVVEILREGVGNQSGFGGNSSELIRFRREFVGMHR